MKIYSAQLKGTTTVATGSNVSLTGSFSGSIAGIDINATNQFTASTSTRLTNIEIISASNINRITSLETNSASVDISISNINAVTASNIARLSNLETKSSSVDISVSSINSKTGSYATTGSNTFFGTQTYSGSVYIANDLIVQGSSSIQYISASSVSIGTNIVQLNTSNPSVRFAGLTIIDSGSIGGSGSFLYDSVQDEFIFVHRGDGTNITSSHFVLGPETYDSLGNETYLTTNILSKGTGKEHLVDSNIFDNGTTICLTGNTIGTGTMCIGGNTTFSNCVGIGTLTPGAKLEIQSPRNSTLLRLTATSGENWDFKNCNIVSSTDILSIGAAGATANLNLKDDGSVGIGTISPSTLLHLNGTTTQLTLQNTDGGTNAERIGMFMTNGDTFKILSLNDNNTTRVDNILVANVLNGSIGIGTIPSSWAAPFTAIQGGCFGQHIGFQTNNADMKIGVNNYYNGSNYIYHTTGKQASQLNISADGGLGFSTAVCGTAGNAVTWIDSFFVTNPGRVGIGIAAPVYQLDVCTSNYKSLRIQSSDDTLITMGSTLASSQFYSIGVSSNASGQGSNLFWIGASTNNPSGTLTKNLIINCSGNVGIAISPSSNYKLGVTGATFIAGNNNKGVFVTDTSTYVSFVGVNSAIAAYNAMELRASGTDYQLYLGTTGNVGIGTCITNVDKLRIEGSVYASSNMYTSNEGTGFMVDANPAACNARVGLMKYGGFEGMLVSGNSTQVRLAHRTDSNFVSGGSPTIRVDVAITPDGLVYVYNLAGSGTRTVTADSSGGLAASSDSSLKQEDSTHQIEGLTEILQLQPRAYKWLKDIEIRGDEAVTEIGFFANEVAPIIPSAAPKNHDGLYGFYDRAVIAALVKGMQEQQCTINLLKSCIGIV